MLARRLILANDCLRIPLFFAWHGNLARAPRPAYPNPRFTSLKAVFLLLGYEHVHKVRSALVNISVSYCLLLSFIFHLMGIYFPGTRSRIYRHRSHVCRLGIELPYSYNESS